MVDKQTGRYTQLIIAVSVLVIYSALIFISNILTSNAVSTGNEGLEIISGMIFAFVAIPVFSIILPLWLANKWSLQYSFWPKSKSLVKVIPVFVFFVVIGSYQAFEIVLKSGVSLSAFSIHYISALLFHITYYPLFAILLLPVFRKTFGLIPALIITSAAFALYHLTQFYYFPAGLTVIMQVLLFVSFFVSLLLYLWSESLVFVALAHTVNGALALASHGTVFCEVGFLFYYTIILMVLLSGYVVFRELRQRKTRYYKKEWWLHVR